MSTPEQGGARSTLMMGRYEYACGSSPSSSCVVSELKDRQLVFFHLDPVKGKGDEITNIAGYQSIQGTWDLSPDGSKLAIVDPVEGKGEIRILNLADRRVTALPMREWKWEFLSRVCWAADGKSLFVLAQSCASIALLSIDPNGNPRVLQENASGIGLGLLHRTLPRWKTPGVHQEGVRRRRDAAGKLLSCPLKASHTFYDAATLATDSGHASGC